MKNIILRNGLWASLIVIAPSFLVWLFVKEYKPTQFQVGEILGYAAIFLAMIFVFLGIRKYRDEELGGRISFWGALKMGLLITLVPSVIFGLYNLLYTGVLNPEFMDQYFNYMLEQQQAGMSAAEFSTYKTQMESQREQFQNPLIQFFVMFLTVFVIGFIVAFVSSFFLKKDKVHLA